MSAPDSVATQWRPWATIARAVSTDSNRVANVLLACSVVAAAVVLGGRLDQGWHPHDDGSLAHSAERVLQGELPHRDFADPYTGLLTFANAAVFAVAGEDMFNLRIPLFVLFLVYAACFFAVARRFVSPVWAFVATLFAIGWSVPVYPAPMPSWYLLFLFTLGTYAIVRFVETDRRRWLLAAGLCGGVSMAIKIVGVWFVAAIALFLIARPLLVERLPASQDRDARIYPASVIGVALVVFAGVYTVLGGRLGPPEVVGLLLPVGALCGAVALLGWRALSEPQRDIAPVSRDVATLVVGVTMPILVLLAPYVVAGGIGDLVRGVFIAPRSRFEYASSSGPEPLTLLRALPAFGLILIRRHAPESLRPLVDALAGAVLAYLIVTATDPLSYSVLWGMTRALAPFVVVLGAAVLLHRSDLYGETNLQLVALVVLVGGFATLLQFPFAVPLYFCYIAPLLLLSAIAGLRRLGRAHGALAGVVLVALVAFGIRQLDTQRFRTLGHEYKVDPQIVILDDARASVRVRPEEQHTYGRVGELVARHRAEGSHIFAGPDAPEVYFLTRSLNPTPSVLDFLDSSGTTRGTRLLRLLLEHDIRVVVLNHRPEQSPRLADETVTRIRSLFAEGEAVGRFEVRWVTERP